MSVHPLTKRELEILQLVLNGLSNKQIAARFDTSYQTVKNQLTGMYPKLDVTNRTQAIVVALRKGLLHL
ncbi:LuxR C-terminal-related transcriptional regulator [Candidatus Bathyarchaeota archaeon]|nr:LuxR C-terminal-related transcriptional regulator [Candidatus Bathyarchaeota archaeon]